MIMRLQKYDIEVQYERGKDMHIADFLSRAYLPSTDHPQMAEFEQVNMASFLPILDLRLQEIRNGTDKDETLQILKSVILQGWPPERSDAPAQVTPYSSLRDELSFQDGLIFRGERFVIPKVQETSNKVSIRLTREQSPVYDEPENVSSTHYSQTTKTISTSNMSRMFIVF